jgi:glucose/arabinose dehydrogenase
MAMIRIMIVFVALTAKMLGQPVESKLIADALKQPAFMCYGPDGSLYVSEMGRFGDRDTGRISKIEYRKPVDFVTGLQHPRGLVYCKPRKAFFATDEDGLLKIDESGKTTVAIAIDKFPAHPEHARLLTSLAVDDFTQSLLIASNVGLILVNLKTMEMTVVANAQQDADLAFISTAIFDGGTHALVMGRSKLHRVNLLTKATETLLDGFSGANAMVMDHFGRVFIADILGRIVAIPRPGMKTVKVAQLGQMYGIMLDTTGTRLIYAENGPSLRAIPAEIPGFELEQSPMPVTTVPAFAKLKWTGWDDGSETGRVTAHRPILMLPAPDGSPRNVAALQHGTIHIFDNSDAATQTKVMLDLTAKVKYADKQNEEGLLGLAFHPQFKTNRHLYVFYTDAAAKLTNVISRFTMKADTPDTIDPASEQVILRIEKPYWNHDGGTLAFGPDGYLYITHGDGGLGNDPHGNGQNLGTWLGKILRIDVDRPAADRPYSVPADNPFLGNTAAKPEIYAYGFRNVWRMSFDPADGRLWAADVGQNLFEEINLVEKGGNYGWSLREGMHPFGPKGVRESAKLNEPIWEYHHAVGKSITGGSVYRGRAMPELVGHYLYADYVNPSIWALKYDASKGRVVANRPIALEQLATMSFGTDAAGEMYVMGATPNMKGIRRLVPAAK